MCSKIFLKNPLIFLLKTPISIKLSQMYHDITSAASSVESKSTDATKFSIQTKSFKLYLLDHGPSKNIHITKDEALNYYKQMTMIRKIEKISADLYRQKEIRGFCHLCIGQEACAVGIRAAMRDHDKLISAYRIHGFAYVMGISAVGILGELTGRNSGCTRGKGGSMHMYAPNFYGGSGIVGSQVSVGTGIALACKYQCKDSVCITVYGDGAANQGQVFESYNMAYLWKLPVVFVCENNGYGMGTSTKRSSCITEYYTRGHIIPGIWIDGMDIISIRAAFEFAIRYAVKNGPIILELHTYRYSGHSMSDSGLSYRSKEEIQEVRKNRDPIIQFKERILNELKIVTQNEIENIDKKIAKEINEAIKKATTDKEISIDEISADVYSNNCESKIRGTTNWDLNHKRINKNKL